MGKDARADHAAYSDMNADDIEDELRDVVFDYENSQALVLMADDFLNDKKPTYKDDLKSESGKSNFSQMSDNSKIRKNIELAGKHDPTKIKLLQDRLDPKSKARLENLLNDIDENMDEIMKEKEEYSKSGMKSTMGGGFDLKS